ncbi:unnamed protein product [Cylicocyclus nassatus]|uniref:Uncharacterized protein n=1 Tax=Cylicocyclus nassatus TaxID=53992 RepID=A0AA36DPJ5_CYLNA|nr:unnamed protein product [Cylicocyclus nassatus]
MLLKVVQANAENNTLLFCVNGSWILNINDTEVKVMDDELLSCKSLNISSLAKF